MRADGPQRDLDLVLGLSAKRQDQHADRADEERPPPGSHPPHGPVQVPQAGRGLPRSAVRDPADPLQQVQPHEDAESVGGRQDFGQAEPRVPAEAARRGQPDRGFGEDAQGAPGILEEAAALPEEPERGLPVPQHLRTCSR